MRRTILWIVLVLFLTGCVTDPYPETTVPSLESGPTATGVITAPSTVATTTVPNVAETTSPTTTPTSAPTVSPTTEPTTAPTTVPTSPPSQAQLIFNNMSLEEKVGQLFLARCPDSQAVQDVANYHLGGYILFGRDFKGQSHEDVSNHIASYQAAAAIPLLIVVDEEGGTVCRVSSHPQFRSSRFPSPRQLYASGGIDLIIKTEVEKISLLKSFGINVNAAPVCDITTDPNAFMYSRSLGETPEITGHYISAMVECMEENQFGGILKHFPGYGNNTDTHVGIAVDSRSLAELEAVDLVPFAAGIQAGAMAIMVSHTFIESIDPDFPASLSPKVVHYLREEMNFQGVVITDDLVMSAITDLYGAEKAAVLAVLAGNDLLCSSEYAIQYQAVLDAVTNGEIPVEVVDRAVMRVLQWKEHLGLLDH